LKSFIKSLLKIINYKFKIKVNTQVFKTLKLYGSVCLVSESWMLEILKMVFQIRQGAFLDVGMNLGQTLIEVKSIDSNKSYVGFEPNPSCIFYVEELVRINKIKNSKVIPVGLYTTDSLLNLDLYEDNITKLSHV
jgi:hypothetical protein